MDAHGTLPVVPPSAITRPDVFVRHLADGSSLYGSNEPLQAADPTPLHWLARWARDTPDRDFLAERHGSHPGAGWSCWSYGHAWSESRALARQWQSQGCRPGDTLIVLATNSIAHARVMLAALWAGMAVAPLTPRLAFSDGGRAKLQHVIGRIAPRFAWLGDTTLPPACAQLLARCGITTLSDTLPAPGSDDDKAGGPALPAGDRVAKIICTSGSTGSPKAVPYTHHMMVSNVQMVLQRWPFLQDGPLVMVDWLPWSHVFGGNNNLNLTLRLGGTLHIDHGAPTPLGLPTTLANLREVSPTFYCNVPAGYAALAAVLARDGALRQTFFRRLQALFFAGAALPEPTRRELAGLAQAERGAAIPVLSGWGSTESGPSATLTHDPAAPGGCVGAPAAGVTLKLVPTGSKLEAWIRSPSVASRYLGDPEASRAAFDADGFFRSGDAMRWADAQDPGAGLVYDGRIAEDFKLLSGTWVNAGTVRAALLQAGGGWMRDVVLLGPNRPELAALVWLDPGMAPQGEAARTQRLQEILASHNARHDSGSQRIARALVLDSPPSLEAGEVNEKGYVNQSRARELRDAQAQRVYAAAPDAGVAVWEGR